mmetsp:Transcript_32747/g.48493  ORF Transcript_32747/g.48493 Transcript_32747/m.48493 type:complete len:299 (+) Transcript_32747:248-1144(+)|eukprot:CAMPEP_0194219940 /NCGR_PEP_ID=MMETSP0156-20130528/27212_1 /TAXON_ID=33649 /ORGANISM="Thalassionema nitzschioides, Strain L26-B" /LENGTH=298 /DNA_ID=CAMNT_0038949791 /DNA_START=244 /DNA_END=1140 /DNA_ORIENTATION=+
MTSWLDGPLKGFFTDRQLDDSRTKMVKLIPFDVILARAGNEEVNSIALTDAVNTWMHFNFGEKVENIGYDFEFDSMKLRQLYEEEVPQRFKITYEGQTLWKKSADVPSELEVAALQVEVMEDRSGLLAELRASSEYYGLGENIVDVKAELNQNAYDQSPNNNNTSQNESLDVIIIIAIVVAVLASLLLLFALIMAWKTGKERKQQAYLDPTPQNTDTTSPVGQSPPQEISNHAANAHYPESVISEDISTSLSAYYKSGMAGGYKANKHKAGALNDAASVSSMESYGYSLDGYASSIAP